MRSFDKGKNSTKEVATSYSSSVREPAQTNLEINSACPHRDSLKKIRRGRKTLIISELYSIGVCFLLQV